MGYVESLPFLLAGFAPVPQEATRRQASDSPSGELLSHVDALYRSALRLTRHPADAEDLVQETYLRAYRFSDRFARGTNAKAWLFTIMVNLFRNRLRRRAYRERPLDDTTLESGGMRWWFSRDSTTPEEVALERSLGRDLRRALDQLPLPMRTAVVLVDVEQFSYKEAAAIMGVKIGTVMSRLSRGRLRLRIALASYAPARQSNRGHALDASVKAASA